MNANCYDFVVSRDCKEFKFWSEGPYGKIEKGIIFSRMGTSSVKVFNLGFGDVHLDGRVDDLAVSNNGDAEKILTTVAKCVIFFTNRYPDAVIYVIGSTVSRTRRYQMGINKYWKEIESMFEVYGFISDRNVEPFRSGKNYLAFVGKRKYRTFEL
jgi:hypothetical protein